jgi:AraC family transcriptional regulator, exoenzyme S synthesis regulatory protein ExsA
MVSHKINQAKNSIFNTKEKNISQIASEAGFYDQSHFSKSFKKVFAINPNEVLK